MYLIHFSDNCYSISTTDKAFYAISLTHKLFWFANFRTSLLPTSTREVCHISIGHRGSSKNLFLQTLLEILACCIVTTLVIYLILELIVCAFLQCFFFLMFKIFITLVCLMALHQYFLWLFDFFMFRKVKLVAILTFLLLGWLYVPLLSQWGIWRKL